MLNSEILHAKLPAAKMVLESEEADGEEAAAAPVTLQGMEVGSNGGGRNAGPLDM